MATITSEISGYHFSTSLPEIAVSTAEETVALKLYDNDSNALIASLTLCAYNGTARAHDIQQVIEDYLLKSELCHVNVDVTAVDAAASDVKYMTVVFCRYLMDTEALTFLKGQFLTTAECRTLYPSLREYLFYAMIAGYDNYATDTVSLTVRYRRSDGSIGLTSWSERTGYDSQKELGYKTLTLELIDNMLPEGKALSVVVEKNERQMLYYVSREEPSCRFMYRNAFNAMETMGIDGVTKRKTDVSSSTAAIGRRLSYYDTRIERTYELDTAPLTVHQCRAVESLVLSPKAYHIEAENVQYDYVAGDEDYMREILIADSDCAFSDTDENPNTAKIKWRFANDQPQFIGQDGATGASGTFSAQFDSTFR